MRSVLFCNRGIIVFENKSYILEPLGGATSEHKIYPAENLKLAPGSCGHQLDISAMRADGNDTSRQSQPGRVSDNTILCLWFAEYVSGSTDYCYRNSLFRRVPTEQTLNHTVNFCWHHVFKIQHTLRWFAKTLLLFLGPSCITYSFFLAMRWHRKVYRFISW